MTNYAELAMRLLEDFDASKEALRKAEDAYEAYEEAMERADLFDPDLEELREEIQDKMWEAFAAAEAAITACRLANWLP